MTDKDLADIVCRALLAIVAGIRRKYGLPDYKGISIVVVVDADTKIQKADDLITS